MENSLANHFVRVKVWTFVDDSVSLRIHCNIYEICACERGNVSLSASVWEGDVGWWGYCFEVHLIHVTSNPTHDGEANRVKHYQSKRFGKIRKEHNLPRRIFLTASHELFFPSLLCTAFALRCLPPPPQWMPGTTNSLNKSPRCSNLQISILNNVTRHTTFTNFGKEQRRTFEKIKWQKKSWSRKWALP